MHVNTYPVIRGFDNRQVWYWELIDKQHRFLASGYGLSKKSALYQARSAAERQGPGLLLDMLETKEA